MRPITMPPNGWIRRTQDSDYDILPKPESKGHGTYADDSQ